MKTKTLIALISIICIVALGLLPLLPQNKTIMYDLSQEEWATQLSQDDNAAILDVRTQDEVDLGFIPKAQHLDFYAGAEFVEELQKLDKTKNYYLYCRSGKRSSQACTIMKELGFNKIYNLEGGFDQWQGDVQD